jgi:hypothetical protein
MTLSEKVRQRISAIEETQAANLDQALAAAERLADEFAYIRPVPYAVPIERFVGMTVEFHAKPAGVR